MKKSAVILAGAGIALFLQPAVATAQTVTHTATHSASALPGQQDSAAQDAGDLILSGLDGGFMWDVPPK